MIEWLLSDREFTLITTLQVITLITLLSNILLTVFMVFLDIFEEKGYVSYYYTVTFATFIITFIMYKNGLLESTLPLNITTVLNALSLYYTNHTYLKQVNKKRKQKE